MLTHPNLFPSETTLLITQSHLTCTPHTTHTLQAEAHFSIDHSPLLHISTTGATKATMYYKNDKNERKPKNPSPKLHQMPLHADKRVPQIHPSMP